MVWVQMFNQINARKVEDEYNVFQGLHKSRIFIYIWVFVVAVQARLALVMTLGVATLLRVWLLQRTCQTTHHVRAGGLHARLARDIQSTAAELDRMGGCNCHWCRLPAPGPGDKAHFQVDNTA